MTRIFGALSNFAGKSSELDFSTVKLGRHEESYELFKLEVQLLNALEKKHWTYSDLAKVMGTQKSAISRDLKGTGLQRASMARIAKMAEALGLRFVPFCVAESKAKRALPLIEKLVAA